MARRWMVLAVLAGAGGCEVAGGGGPEPCAAGGKCDAPDTVRSALDGLEDPVARWLRRSPMSEDGRLDTDYLRAVEEIAAEMGCSMDSMRTFALSDDLVMGTPFPRLISTLCTDDDTRASEFFIAASFADPARPDDVDARNLEMFAWDAAARQYRFYAALPVESSGDVQIEVEPRRCSGCHLNSRSLDDDGMPMLPIMNELTRPWPHWNAEPDFPSHTFEVSEATRRAPSFAAITGEGRLASAATFEQIIRAAQSSRVVAARLRARRDPAELGAAMALLRPVFCDEQVNYATEDFGSGVMPASTVITGGTRDMFLAHRPSDWPWAWLNGDVVRLDATSGERLAMVPVRGAADVEYERRLVALRGLSAVDVLRVRALDWTTPVFSELRCSLWKDARARLRERPPAFELGATNGDVLPLLYREIMTIDGHSLLVGGPEQVVAVSDASQRDALVAALARGALDGAACAADGRGVCLADLDQFGELLDRRVRAVEAAGGRSILFAERDQRLCVVDREFASRPAFPAVVCGKDPGLSPEMAPREFGLESADASFGGASREVRLIPDGDLDGVTSEIQAGGVGPGAASVVTVRVAIAHGWRGDLTVLLTAPTGETAEVARFDPADSGNDLDGVFPVFLDAAAGDGPWRLTVIDAEPGEQGFLEGWSLGIGELAPGLEAPGARVAP